MGQVEDLTGLVVKTWRVDKYIKRGIWECECTECGAKEQFRAYHLKRGIAKQCTHGGNHSFKVDLSGKQFGQLKVLRYNSDTGKWVCKCSCGKISEYSKYSLTIRNVKSCGHNTNNFKDRAGQLFGELTAKRYLGNYIWECECSCGKIINVRTGDLTSGNTKSCGHIKGKYRVIDLKNKQIGEWKVIRYLGKSFWECECSCGTIKPVHSYALRNGKTLKCNNGLHTYIDLTNQVFGELTAKKYLGRGVWECECTCGNTKNILGCNLRNGSTNSCGCKTLEFLQETLLKTYGDTNPAKAKLPRSEMQREIINSSKLLEAMILNFTSQRSRKPTLRELGELLGIHRVTVKNYIDNYKLNNLIQIGYNISSYEYELRELFPNAIYNDKKILNGKELDIYLPDQNIAIEFNGTYWHSDIFKDRMYHQRKVLECEEKGVRLIHIFEYEWLDDNKQEKIKSYLKNLLDTNKNKIYARNTEVEYISVNEAQAFCEKYHLQGYVKSVINLGLKHNSELVGVMTFGYSRFNQNYQFEILRLCYKDNIAVIGGTEKLFDYFKSNFDVKSVISYCDISKFEGRVYENLGFKLSHISKPSYVWVDTTDNDVLSRYQTQKQKLLSNGLGRKEQTEDTIMESIGYLKVYDAGNKVFIYEHK